MSLIYKKRKSNLTKKYFDKKATKITECGSDNISKCGSINRIGIILSYYNKWLKVSKKDKLKCGMFEYIHSGQKIIKLKKQNSKNLDSDARPKLANNNSNNFNYSSVKLLDDYHHILYDHDNTNSLESIYDYILSKYLSSTTCKTKTCKILSRNNRDRWSCSMNNVKRIGHYQGFDSNEQVYILQLCDRIHSTLIHSFDCAYKLNKKDINLIETETKTFSINKKLKYILNVIIKPKRKKIRRIRGSNRYKKNKFISFYDLNDQKQQQEEEEEEESDSSEDEKKDDNNDEKVENKQKYIEYNFGFVYRYWDGYKNDKWYIPKKYKDLRNEIVNNDTHKISLNQFNDCLKSAIDLVNCKKGKILKCKYLINKNNEPQFEQIGIDQDNNVTIDHILSLIFITNFDHLYQKFISTFKKTNESENDCDLVKRHSEFTNLGRLSFELIHLYGIDVNDNDNNKINVWYHGFDQQQIFQDTFIKFDLITSTTNNLNVALNYSNGIGLILKLNKSKFGKYFDCRWISDYSNEYENIFVQNEFKFKSILNITLYHDYEWYLNILNIIKLMYNGMCMNNNILNQNVYSFLGKLVNDKITQKIENKEEAIFGTGFVSNSNENDEVKELDKDEIPSYVIELFKRYCNDKHRLIMNMWSMSIEHFKMFNDEKTVYYGYKLIRDLFIDNKEEWIYLSKLTDLYGNAELICIYNVDWVTGVSLASVKLNNNFANKLLSFLSLNSSLLMNIWIYLPDEKELKMQEFIDNFGSQFEYIKWKPTIQQKQIPGLGEQLGDIQTLCITYEGQKDKDDKEDEQYDNNNDNDDSDSDSY